jgi:adenylosuccinate lyase
LLARLKELREPMASGQVGSSAMPYKANPMRSERVTALARWLIAMAANPAQTAASQWLERTLDDSANRRMALPEAFLAADAILTIVHNVVHGLQVFPAMIARNLAEELPLMASEAILMEGVRRGGDRQALHERLRIHARAAAQAVLSDGADRGSPRPRPLRRPCTAAGAGVPRRGGAADSRRSEGAAGGEGPRSLVLSS